MEEKPPCFHFRLSKILNNHGLQPSEEKASSTLNIEEFIPGAVPSVLPDLPKYFSAEPIVSRENPNDRLRRKEME
ncbi:hypothetical protein AVEN_120096-1 [Araneus ventricosus]|uniref:Uncharacterized protein n=1 Tax=Araneus ventricosus TaxID=182803 RepID=A0A4Y2G4W0_ARAVE|nr:hypothetical protein AVEN_120096-1 [Araneus ventricosus]